MPFPAYSTFLSVPGGDPAADWPVGVFSRGSTQPTLLFSDSVATTPLANPVMTDGEGRLFFYAAPGDYMVPLAGEWFWVPLDSSVTEVVWSNLWTHEQETPSSVWTINHHFGVSPSVEILIDGESVESVVTHPSLSQTVITHGS